MASTISTAYVPGTGDGWERRAPSEVGMDEARVQEAVELIVASESVGGHETRV